MYDGACDLLQAAREIEEGAESGGVMEDVPATLGTIEEALRVLSSSCYQLAGDAVREQLLSRENEAHLMATLHQVASGIAQCARACRTGREIVAPLIARKVNATHGPGIASVRPLMKGLPLKASEPQTSSS